MMLRIDIRHDALDCLAEAVLNIIELFKRSLELSDMIDEDRLAIAALEELWVMLEKKRDSKKYKARMAYKITFTPVMSFAFRVAFAGLTYCDPFIGNLLGRICNDIDREYAKPNASENITP